MSMPFPAHSGQVKNGSSVNGNGVAIRTQYIQELGAVDTLDADGICVAATATGAATLSATGALVSGGVATFDVPRAVTLTSTGNNAAVVFTVTGTDKHGNAVVETITGINNSSVAGKKAFKTVTSIASSAAVVGSLTAGTNNVLGFDYRLDNKGECLGVYVDGVPETTLTLVTGFSATGTSTATTADVRGTFTPNTAPNGAKYFTAVMALDDDLSITELNGAAQFGG